MPSFLFTPTPHKEAIAFIKDKGLIPASVFAELLPELQARAFTVAGIESANVLQEIRDTIATLPDGGDWDTIKQNIADTIHPFMSGTSDDPNNMKPALARAEILIRMHGFQAYASAQYKVMDRQRDAFPFWQYLTMGDSKVRATHRALDGIVLPANHEFWNTHYPPWDYGCRCQMVPLTQDDVDEMRDKEKSDKIKPNQTKLIFDNPIMNAQLTNERKLVRGINEIYDLRAPREKAVDGKPSFYWHPGNLGLDLDSIKGRYDPEVFAEFEAYAKRTKLTPKKTLWQWLSKNTPVVQPAPVPVPTAASPVKFPDDLSKLTVVKKLGGSTGAELVKDENGNLFVRKYGSSPDHLREEAAADELYRAMGVPVPDGKLYEDKTRPVKLTQYIEGRTLAEVMSKGTAKEKAEITAQVQAGFAVDALLGNWDVAGMGLDNILVDNAGVAHRIDNGGALRFRAQGAPKTMEQFNKYPTELWTLRDASVNADSAKLFAGADIYQIAAQIKTIKPELFVSAPPAVRMLLEERLAQMQSVADKAIEYQKTNFIASNADAVTKHVIGMRKAGVMDVVADKLELKNPTDLVPVDEQGRAGDNLRSHKPATKPSQSDVFYSAILPGVTTVNGHHHLGNVNYNQTKIATALAQKPALEKLSKSGTASEKKMAKHYLDSIKEIEAASGDTAKILPMFLKHPEPRTKKAAPKDRTAIEALAEYMQANGGDWSIISSWADAQGNSSKSAQSMAIKRWFMDRLDGATSNEFHHPPSAQHLATLHAVHGAKLDASFEMFQAFNQEVFSKMDFPGNDRAAKQLRLIRVETNSNAVSQHLSPGEKGQYQRGVNESASLYTEFSDASGAVTITAVPHTRATSCYFYEAKPGKGGDLLLGDGENEITYIGWKLDALFVGIKKRVKRAPSTNRGDWEI